MTASAGLVARPSSSDEMEAHGIFIVQHIRDGEVIWEDTFHNLVTNQGKNSMLDKFLGLGAAHTNCLMGLVSAAAIAGDTYASHAFTEITTYTGNRPAVSFSAASAGAKATSSNVSFSINGTATVAGCEIVMSAGTTPGDTATAGAVLLSAGTFASSRSVLSGDTLSVSYSLSL